MILDVLYSLVIIINAAAYMPQIYALWRTDSDSRDIALGTWFTWLFTSTISLLYAVYRIHDMKLTLVSLANFIGITAIIVLTLRNRVMNKKPPAL